MPSDSTRKRRRRKTLIPPQKPYQGFPLTPHSTGKWQKKILGQTHYFGRWAHVVDGNLVRVSDDGWRDALAEYDQRKAALHDGRTPRAADLNDPTLAELCNKFLTSKMRKVKAGELSVRSFQEYKQTTDLLINAFGRQRLVTDISSADFEELREKIAERCGPVRLGNEIVRVRSVFKYAVKNGMIQRAVEFGSEFTRPSKQVLRRHKAMSDKKLFEPSEIRVMLDATLGKEGATKDKLPNRLAIAADPQIHAAILISINAGLGNTDLSDLQLKHVDLDAGWLVYPRGKTGIDRRMPLWKETCDALKLAIAGRANPKAAEDANCVFLTRRGTRLVRVGETSRTDYIGREFNNLLHSLGINGRDGLGLYSIRHTFATVALQTGDRDTVRSLMGHVESDVLALYDETGPSDERRLAVVRYIHEWLFARPEK